MLATQAPELIISANRDCNGVGTCWVPRESQSPCLLEAFVLGLIIATLVGVKWCFIVETKCCKKARGSQEDVWWEAARTCQPWLAQGSIDVGQRKRWLRVRWRVSASWSPSGDGL